MPNMPVSDDWTTWIITTIFGAAASLWGIVVWLAKFIENKYRVEVTELKAEIKEVRDENKKCQDDRIKLFSEVAVLKDRVTKIEPSIPEKG